MDRVVTRLSAVVAPAAIAMSLTMAAAAAATASATVVLHISQYRQYRQYRQNPWLCHGLLQVVLVFLRACNTTTHCWSGRLYMCQPLKQNIFNSQ